MQKTDIRAGDTGVQNVSFYHPHIPSAGTIQFKFKGLERFVPLSTTRAPPVVTLGYKIVHLILAIFFFTRQPEYFNKTRDFNPFMGRFFTLQTETMF